MENQEEKETSLEYYHDKVLDFIIINDIQGEFLIDSFYKAKKMYEEDSRHYIKIGRMSSIPKANTGSNPVLTTKKLRL